MKAIVHSLKYGMILIQHLVVVVKKKVKEREGVVYNLLTKTPPKSRIRNN